MLSQQYKAYEQVVSNISVKDMLAHVETCSKTVQWMKNVIVNLQCTVSNNSVSNMERSVIQVKDLIHAQHKM